MSYFITILGDISAVAITCFQGWTQVLCHIRNKCFETRQNVFQIFYLLISQRDLSLICQNSWIRLWTVTSLFSSMSRVAGWCLLRMITKQASSFYLCKLEKVFEEVKKYLRRGLFVKIVGLRTTAYFKRNSTQTLCQKSAEVVDCGTKR